MKKPVLLTTLCRRAVLCVAALTAVLTTETARAQYLQVKAGGGLSTLYSGARAVGAYKFGVGYEYELGQRWSIAPALTFSGKGWKDPDRAVHLTDDDDRPLYNDDGTPRYGVMSRSAAACYLQLPVLLCYYHRLGPGRYILLGGGPYAALGIAGKTKIKGDASRHGSEKVYAEHNTFGHDGVRRFDAGVQLTAGYRHTTLSSDSYEALSDLYLQGSYALDQVWRGLGVFLEAHNLLDKAYEFTPGVPALGLRVMGGVSLRF